MKIAIVVNSCYKYCMKTIPKILENLENFNDVFIVVGESESDYEYNCTFMGANSHFRKWANMDNNGLIWVVSEDGRKTLSHYDWVFYIHDTCVPSKDFVRSVYDTFEKYNYSNCDAIKLNKVSMSMGYYKLSKLWCEDVSNYIVSNVNYDKSETVIKDIKSKVEDSVFNHIETTFVIPNNQPIVTEECENVYGSQTKRIIENWTEPSFLKMKANYNGTFEIIEL